ncbi:hypothetical protein, partial [Paenibacillus sp. sgz500958]|uniref:hypothetical protein n=1 Tax=Paenibacillus sp. sgz500958 TaxID=3242475 RepID=UPI0036D3AB75
THSLFSFQRSMSLFRDRRLSAATFIIYHSTSSFGKHFFQEKFFLFLLVRKHLINKAKGARDIIYHSVSLYVNLFFK